MTVEKIAVEGCDAFFTEVEKHNGKTVYVMFSGSKTSDGKSWCPDCVTAEPVVNAQLDQVTSDIVYIYCGVGERAFWKDKTNVFRTNPKLKLTSVPTLIKWKTPMRLTEAECASKDLVADIFEE